MIKKFILELIIYIFCIYNLVAYAENNSKQNFFIGVNGHPLTQEGYRSINLLEQIKLLKELKIHWYRVDVSEDIEGLDKLVNLFRSNGIYILPVIFPPVDLDKETSYEVIKRKSYNYAFKLSKLFIDRISVWEIHNELCNFVILKKYDKMKNDLLYPYDSPDGDIPSHYNEERYNKVRSMLEGMSNGIHDGNPKSRRIINSGWLHYGFIKRIIDDGIDFEIIGWHWYSDMGKLTDVNYRKINLLEKLETFNKEIWLTEGNYRGGTINGDSEQYLYIKNTIEEMKFLFPRVKNYFIYELLDEPYFGENNPESYYGLISIKKDEKNNWKTFSKKKSFYYLAN